MTLFAVLVTLAGVAAILVGVYLVAGLGFAVLLGGLIASAVGLLLVDVDQRTESRG